jgi:hypothetical protein
VKPTEVKTEDAIRVQLVHAWPDRYWSLPIALSANATVADALRLAEADMAAAGIDACELTMAIFGRGVEAHTRLRDGDRLELLRPLLISPQQARAGRAAAARRASRK